MNPITLPKLTKASATLLAANWTWAQAYWTTRKSDAELIYDAAVKHFSSTPSFAMFTRFICNPTTKQRGFLLIRVE